jgi:chemotaxis response regulator CheB
VRLFAVGRNHGPAVWHRGDRRDQGIRKIQQGGGLAIAQDEAGSEVFDMLLAARDRGGADLVLPLRQVAAALQMLVKSSL